MSLSVVHAPEGNMTAGDVRVSGVRTIGMYVGIHIMDYVRSLLCFANVSECVSEYSLKRLLRKFDLVIGLGIQTLYGQFLVVDISGYRVGCLYGKFVIGWL